MSNKLGAGEQFPSIILNVGSNQSISVPEDLETEYTMLLIYRGHWCPLCMRNLAKYKEHLAELEAMNCGVIAGSVDELDKATEVGADFGFPVAHGMTRETGELIGAWWEEKRQIIQPSEFLLDRQGIVISSTYSSSPLGRTDPVEVVAALKHKEKVESQS